MTPASQMEFAEHATVEATTDDLDCSEVIFLPQSEPIPQQFWSMAQGWIPVVGRDIVACLFSRDWQVIYGLPLVIQWPYAFYPRSYYVVV